MEVRDELLRVTKYEAAGKEQLLAERKKIGDIPAGGIAVTPSFCLNAKYIIHTVGPDWHGGSSKAWGGSMISEAITPPFFV